MNGALDWGMAQTRHNTRAIVVLQDLTRGQPPPLERVMRGGAWNAGYPAWARPPFPYHNAPATKR